MGDTKRFQRLQLDVPRGADRDEVVRRLTRQILEQVQGRASTSKQERGKPVDEPGKESSS